MLARIISITTGMTGNHDIRYKKIQSIDQQEVLLKNNVLPHKQHLMFNFKCIIMNNKGTANIKSQESNTYITQQGLLCFGSGVMKNNPD